MRIGDTPLGDTGPNTVNTIKLGTQIVWERGGQAQLNELVVATDGFLVKEPDGYLVK